MMGGQQLLLQSRHDHQQLLIDCSGGRLEGRARFESVMFMAQQPEAVLKSALNCPHRFKI